MAQLQRLLLLEIGGAEDRDRGAVAKPGEAIELTAQQPAPATEILRSEILDVEIDLAGGPDDRNLADHFSRPRLGRPKRQSDIVARQVASEQPVAFGFVAVEHFLFGHPLQITGYGALIPPGIAAYAYADQLRHQDLDTQAQ